MATIVSSAWTMSGITLSKGGGDADEMHVYNRGAAVDTVLTGSSAYARVYSGAILNNPTVSAGACLILNGGMMSGGTISYNDGNIYRGQLYIRDGAICKDIDNSGEVWVSSGGLLLGGTNHNALFVVGGSISGTTISDNNIRMGYSGFTGARGTGIHVAKGNLIVSNGAVVDNVHVSGITSDPTWSATGATVHVQNSGVVNNIDVFGALALRVSSGGLATNIHQAAAIYVSSGGRVDRVEHNGGVIGLFGGTATNINMHNMELLPAAVGGAYITLGASNVDNPHPEESYLENVVESSAGIFALHGSANNITIGPAAHLTVSGGLGYDPYITNVLMTGVNTRCTLCDGTISGITMSDCRFLQVGPGTGKVFNLDMYEKGSTYVSSGGVLDGAVLHNTPTTSDALRPKLYVSSGGLVLNAIVGGTLSYGGGLFIYSGGITSKTRHHNYVTYVYEGGIMIDPIIESNGQLYWVNGTVINPTLYAGAVSCHSGGVISGGQTSDGKGIMWIYGSASGVTAGAGSSGTGSIYFLNGGPTSNATYPTNVVGQGSDITIKPGGTVVCYGGTVNGVNMPSTPGGTYPAHLYVYSPLQNTASNSGYATNVKIGGQLSTNRGSAYVSGGHISGADVTDYGFILVSSGGLVEDVDIHDHANGYAILISRGGIASNVRHSGYVSSGWNSPIYCAYGTLKGVTVSGGGLAKYSVLGNGGTISDYTGYPDYNELTSGRQLSYMYCYNGTHIENATISGYGQISLVQSHTTASGIHLLDDNVTSRGVLYIDGGTVHDITGYGMIQLRPHSGHGAYASNVQYTYPKSISETRLAGAFYVSGGCVLEGAVLTDHVRNTYIYTYSGAVVSNITLQGNHMSAAPISGSIWSKLTIVSNAHCDGYGTNGGAMFYDVTVEQGAFYPKANDITTGLIHRNGTTNLQSGCITSNCQISGTQVFLRPSAKLYNTEIFSSGLLTVFSTGIASTIVVHSGGRLIVSSGGSAIDVTSQAGANVSSAAGAIITYKP